MKKPEDSTVVNDDGEQDADKIAAAYIEALDDKFSRADVVKIAEWIHYLSTQA